MFGIFASTARDWDPCQHCQRGCRGSTAFFLTQSSCYSWQRNNYKKNTKDYYKSRTGRNDIRNDVRTTSIQYYILESITPYYKVPINARSDHGDTKHNVTTTIQCAEKNNTNVQYNARRAQDYADQGIPELQNTMTSVTLSCKTQRRPA